MLGRIIDNIALALALGGAGGYLLAQDALFLPAKVHPTAGTLFAGWSLWSLAVTLFALAGFAVLAARDWWAVRRRHAPLPTRLSRLMRYALPLLLAASSLALAFATAEDFQAPPDTVQPLPVRGVVT